MNAIDFSKALLDPGSVFPSPEDLLEEPSLKKAQKIELLKRWKYDAREISDATSEGMPGNRDGDIFRRVSLALEFLEQNA